ncbi:hypothetical protein [Coleofasciculus sp.]|uniref:hypothetical protein n=2 Tax=unclassified Coleofasciculus TaxID=2692782 RepID=UPI0039F82726
MLRDGKPDTIWLMLKVGTLIRVIHPEYAAGIQGIIQGREESGRWVVCLEKNLVNPKDVPLIVSLDESDFEVIQPEES